MEGGSLDLDTLVSGAFVADGKPGVVVQVLRTRHAPGASKVIWRRGQHSTIGRFGTLTS